MFGEEVMMSKQKAVYVENCFRCKKFKYCYMFFLEDMFSWELWISDGYICISCFEIIKRRILHMDPKMMTSLTKKKKTKCPREPEN